ncbi:FecCD family ABC transporter permease [Gordonia liuliyuniae]|uniref:Iron chelate uptake ABC transporter family permease subunit n=1 Tax=Gordonia liuliyuniae TaxID=2911517 RepID=A0ABS9IV41_9ACTN|nr:iron chelate uptake ABC transporter family permease subunit [Gordonia liuliyuniae]MCF8589432.1 iron chelate uptake ABC transporter family permease subunit [Gordonia liuliyuniae]
MNGVQTRLGTVVALWFGGLALLLVSIGFAITIGPSGLGMTDVGSSVRAELFGGDSGLSRLEESIIWKLRLPQSVLAAACGAGLAVCGGVLQSLLRNPLADPFVLGVSSGASVGAVSVILLGFGAGVIGMAGGAFVGALAAFALVLLLARLAGDTTDRVVLAGIAATQLFSALTSFIVYTSADAEQTRGVLFWLLGSLSSPSWTEVAVCGIVTVAGLVICLLSSGALDAFAFGNDAAASLGINVARTRLLLLSVTALITAVVVSVSGAIGFVGLVLPHAARAIVGVRHRVMLPTLAIIGALFLVWADVAGRVLIAPRELPIGVITAIVGVPAFVVVLIRQGRR